MAGAYLGDFNAGDTVYLYWDSNGSSGQSITRSTNGTVSVYKNGSTTQTTTGVTDTEDFDSLTGIHLAAIDTSSDGTFYAAGNDFTVILSGATIDTQTVNAVLGSFSIRNRSALMPTTADRTLDVSATGEAGVDWANVGSPTSTVGLTNTTVGTVTTTTTATAVTTVNGLAAGVITAAAVATGAIDADALAADAANEIADALLDRSAGVETGYTPRQALRLILSALAAKLSGAGTTSVVIRDVGDTKARITATVDDSGNRTAVTLDAT